MPLYFWVLVAFAAWTFLLLAGSLGVRRFASAVPLDIEGTDWSQRAMRAHLNCVENLPVFAAIVLAALAARISDPLMDVLAVVIIVARVLQSTAHVTFQPTRAAAVVRFFFFFLQAAAFLVMIYLVADGALNYQRLGR